MKLDTIKLNLCIRGGSIGKQNVLDLLGKEIASFKPRVRSLEMILCHCVWFPESEIIISMANETYPPERYNPNNISAKPFQAVIKYLDKHGYIKFNKGDNPYTKHLIEPDVDDEAIKIIRASTFIPLQKGIELATTLGITDKNIHYKNNSYLRFKSIKDQNGKQKLLDFVETDKTRQMENEMRNYCAYLNKQDIRLDDTQFKHIHLTRNFTDYDNTNKLEYGGRIGGYWVSVYKEDRPRIKINGQKTKSLDYQASQYNRLYHFVTGRTYEHGDPYELYVGKQKHKIDRKIVKQVGVLALNVKETRATNALNNWHQPINKYTGKEKRDRNWSGEKQAQVYADTLKLRGVNALAIRKAFVEKHHIIKDYLYKATRGGQFVSWLESNLVFYVAYMASEWEITCLTIHDEFLVPEDKYDAMQELMYSSYCELGEDFVDLRDRKEYHPIYEF